MSTELQVKEIVEEPITVTKVIELRPTISSPIAVVDKQLVGNKILNIMLAGLEESADENHGINSIIFRMDNYPKLDTKTPVSWMFFPDSSAAVCNVMECIKNAFTTTQDEESPINANLSIFAGVWKNILGGFFHESHHAITYLTERNELDTNESAREVEEEKAEIFSQEMLFSLAKKFDLEIEFPAELTQLITDRLKDNIKVITEMADDNEHLKDWCKYQEYMLENGGVFFDAADGDDEDNMTLTTFKKFCHVASGDEVDDPDWATDVNPIEVVELEAATTPMEQNATGGIGISFEEDLPFTPDIATGFEGVANNLENPTVGQTYIAPALPPQQATVPMTPVMPTQQPLMAEKMYSDTQFSPETFQGVIKSLYLKIFAHIFQKCGYSATSNPFFTNVNSIAEQVLLTPEEGQIAKEMVCYNEKGQIANTIVGGWISGRFIDKAKTLPGFELKLSTPEGIQTTRKFIPQNPWKKRADGQFSSTALEAQAGNQILWVIDPNAIDKQFATRIHNGILQSNVSGTWTNV